MRCFYLPVKFAFLVSLSLAVSSSSPSFLSFSSIKSSQTPSSPKTAASNLLALLGSREKAARINRQEAESFRSCLRFLVPFSPERSDKSPLRGLEPTNGRRSLMDSDEDALVWWPPEPVMELARLAVDSGGDPDAIYRAIDPTIRAVPDVDGCKKDRCTLTRTPYGRRFINKELNSYLAFLFEIIVSRGPSVGLNVSLDRYDLFHGHLFLATDSGRLGILFHAKEYPAYDKEVFPINMGYCQTGSNIKYDDLINLRNILWLAPLPSNVTKAWLAPGVLVVLDAKPEGIIYKTVVSEYVEFVRTIYEDDFGDAVVDVNYLNVRNAAPGDKIFVC